MLADPEDVEPNLVGELDLLDQVAQPLRRAHGARGQFGEGIDAKFHVALNLTEGEDVGYPGFDLVDAVGNTGAMNGMHDMGGMHGFGPIEPRSNEEAFHAEW